MRPRKDAPQARRCVVLLAAAGFIVAGCGATKTKTRTVIKPVPSAPVPLQQQCVPNNPRATGCTPEGAKELPRAVARISSVSSGPTIDGQGLRLIEFFEGYSRCAYYDPYGGVWTAGFGQTIGIYGGFCFKDRAAAETNLATSVRRGYEWAVHEACGHACGIHQVNALDSFAYNLGPYIFRLNGSLRADIHAGAFYSACQIMRGYVHAGGVTLSALVTRRRLECNELLRPSPNPSPPSRGELRRRLAHDQGRLVGLRKRKRALVHALVTNHCKPHSRQHKCVVWVGEAAAVHRAGVRLDGVVARLKRELG